MGIKMTLFTFPGSTVSVAPETVTFIKVLGMDDDYGPRIVFDAGGVRELVEAPDHETARLAAASLLQMVNVARVGEASLLVNSHG